jgi:hypothetical protein
MIFRKARGDRKEPGSKLRIRNQSRTYARTTLWRPKIRSLLPAPRWSGTHCRVFVYKSSSILPSHPTFSTMSSSVSQILDDFDPHAIHPFTNGSGLAPPAPKPSQYPIPIPSPRRPYAFSPTYSQYYDSSDYKQSPPSTSPDSSTSVSSNTSSSPAYAPQPRRRPTSNSPSRSPTSPTQPIFVPFRQDTSSPDLVLKKKAPMTKSASTQTPATSQKS